MKIIPLKYYDGGYMTQAFAFGGTRDKSQIDPAVKYGSSLQNPPHGILFHPLPGRIFKRGTTKSNPTVKLFILQRLKKLRIGGAFLGARATCNRYSPRRYRVARKYLRRLCIFPLPLYCMRGIFFSLGRECCKNRASMARRLWGNTRRLFHYIGRFCSKGGFLGKFE